jgi:hypothetical protein
MTLNLNNIDAYKLAQLRYGVQKPHSFPPRQLTNLNDFSNLCFNTAAEFVDTNVIPLENTPAGQKCQIAMIQQLGLNGREHPGLKLRLPIILSRPQYFKDAYLATGSVDDAYKISVNSCITNHSPGLEQTTCIERCGNARDALLLTLQTQHKTSKHHVPSHSDNNHGDINPNDPTRDSGDINPNDPTRDSGDINNSNCASIISCGNNTTDSSSTTIPSQSAIKSLTDSQLAPKPSILAYEGYENNNNGRCGGIIFIIFIIIIILVLIGSLVSGNDTENSGNLNSGNGGGSTVQLKNAFSSKRKQIFSRKR